MMQCESLLPQTSPLDDPLIPMNLQVVSLDLLIQARQQRDEALEMVHLLSAFVGYEPEYSPIRSRMNRLLKKHGKGHPRLIHF